MDFCMLYRHNLKNAAEVFLYMYFFFILYFSRFEDHPVTEAFFVLFLFPLILNICVVKMYIDSFGFKIIFWKKIKLQQEKKK